jgi:AraC-like DNA-binding protein
MQITRAIPHPALQKAVRLFEERRVDLGSAVLAWPVPARPHQILDIHLAQPYTVRINGGPAKSTPETFIVGPQTRPRARIFLSGRVHVFTILFQPAGLNQLTGIDMRSLVNESHATTDVFGRSGLELADVIRAARDFSDRVRAAERWLDARLSSRASFDEVINIASSLLVATSGQIRIDDLVRRSRLSASQFQRRFANQVGITPKSYGRLIRFDKILVTRRNAPERSWTNILHDFGYFDQAHFIREFQMFAGISPTGFRGDWENVFLPGND